MQALSAAGSSRQTRLFEVLALFIETNGSTSHRARVSIELLLDVPAAPCFVRLVDRNARVRILLEPIFALPKRGSGQDETLVSWKKIDATTVAVQFPDESTAEQFRVAWQEARARNQRLAHTDDGKWLQEVAKVKKKNNAHAKARRYRLRRAERKAGQIHSKNEKVRAQRQAEAAADKGGLSVAPSEPKIRKTIDSHGSGGSPFDFCTVIIRNQGHKARQLKRVVVLGGEQAAAAVRAARGAARSGEEQASLLDEKSDPGLFVCALDGTRVPYTLDPKSTIRVSVRATTPAYPGISRATLVFDFTSFSIVRFLELECGDQRLIEKLAPVKPYQRSRGRKRAGLKGKAVGAGVRTAMKIKPFVVRLGEYKPSDVARRYFAANSKMSMDMICRDAAFPRDHWERMHLMLWAHEMQEQRDLWQFTMVNARMQAHGRERLGLCVPGLAEDRPSLAVGDSVHVEWKKDGVQIGYVREVRQLDVYLSFAPIVHRTHTPTKTYVVEFRLRRTTLRLMHQGVDLTRHQRHLMAMLLPVEVAHSPSVRARSIPTVDGANSVLNTRQAIAVEAITDGAGRRIPFLLWGPPGTGKTFTLTAAIACLVKQGKRVLACAPTNVAADQLAEVLVAKVSGRKVVRVNAFHRAVASMAQVVLECSTPPTLHGTGFLLPESDVIDGSSVVVATLATAAKLHNSGAANTETFGAIVVDEAGQALEPEVLAVLGPFFKPGVQVILAGDPKQLGPIVRSEVARDMGLGRSLLERLMDDFSAYRFDPDVFTKVSGGYNAEAACMLVNNYRSAAEIFRVPNELFYRGELRECADRRLTHSLLDWDQLPCRGVPLLFHSVCGAELREANSPSWFNVAEVSCIIEYIASLLQRKDVRPSDIGVIAPYRKQVQKIRSALRIRNVDVSPGGIKVGSTEMFQGQERKVILISTVRSDPHFLPIDVAHRLGFVAHPQRFNVAVTRAQALLVIVGNADVLCVDENWAALLKQCRDLGAWRGPRCDALGRIGVVDEGECDVDGELEAFMSSDSSDSDSEQGNDASEDWLSVMISSIVNLDLW